MITILRYAHSGDNDALTTPDPAAALAFIEASSDLDIIEMRVEHTFDGDTADRLLRLWSNDFRR